MKPRLVLALLLTAICALTLGAGSAQASKRMEVAIQDDNAFLGKRFGFSPQLALDRAKEIGVTRIRVNVSWTQVVGDKNAAKKKAPKGLRYQWAEIDRLIDLAAARGIRIHLCLTGPAPAYATAKRRKGVYKVNPAKFAAFARAAARHFKGRVDRYSIWNEPNLDQWLTPSRSAPKIYRKLFESSFKAIKRADKKAKVLIGETAPYEQKRRNGKLRTMAPVAFVRAVACVNKKYKRSGKKCKPLKADGYAHHPYDYRVAPNRVSKVAKGRDNATMGQISNLTRALSKLAKARALRTPKGRPLDVYLTEFGYFRKNAKTKKNYLGSEKRRASYLVRAFKLAQKNRRIKQQLQYLLVEISEGDFGDFFDMSLLDSDNKETLPFAKLRSWAAKAAAKGQIKKPGVRVFLPPKNP